MWNPGPSQWGVMWVALALAFLLWEANGEFIGLHLFIVAAAILLIWMLEVYKKRPKS